MPKAQKAVQFCIISKDGGLLVEQLRYAGVLSVVRETEMPEGDGVWVVLKLRCPAGINSEIWAKMNVERIRSFGINAEVVNG